MSKLGAIIVFGIIAIVCVSSNVSAWSGKVNYSPTTISTGQDVTFRFTFTNTGSSAVKITNVGVHFDWMQTGYFYFYAGYLPKIINPGATATFDIRVPIPDNIETHTYHSFTLRIEGADPGWFTDWGSPYTKDYYGSVFVELPTYTVHGYIQDENGNPISGATIYIGSKSTISGPGGYYSLSIKKGTYTMSVEAKGYKTYSTTIVVSSDVTKNVILTKSGDSSLSVIGAIASPEVAIPITIIIILLITALIAYGVKRRKKEQQIPPPMPPPYYQSYQQPPYQEITNTNQNSYENVQDTIDFEDDKFKEGGGW